MSCIVVIGENGQVARSLASVGVGKDFRFFGRSKTGGGGLANVEAIIETARPGLVLNAAAYTLVDQAEKERDAAYALNADLPRMIAMACSRRRVPFVHVSSDYVFDGAKAEPYLEGDVPRPLGVYGASKLAGERAIAEAASVPYAILRASWVFSHVGETFPRKILRRARQQGALRVVNDQRGCPTPADDLALAMVEMGRRLMDGDEKAQGLFNFCGDVAMSWFDFAVQLVKAARPHGLGDCRVEPMASSELQLPAKRPANSVLDCSKIRLQCGIAPAPVAAAIEKAAARIMTEDS